jgi:tRNA U34 5-methylaminomethyl-2-thiouridine-forming methyltransferase MnmC
MRITPAELGFDSNGTPYSAVYGDVYHSADSGPGQARHVFVGGNGLPHAWAGTRVFTILETGFGLGLNFLATWAEWRDDPARPARLHYVSIEKHPFDRDALERVHRQYAELAPLAAQLHAAWPALVRGLHRLHFESGRVTLTLAFGEIGAAAAVVRRRDLSRRLRAAAQPGHVVPAPDEKARAARASRHHGGDVVDRGKRARRPPGCRIRAREASGVRA